MKVFEMRDEYEIDKLNPRKNPYTNRLKKQVTINLNEEVIDYFKQMSEQSGLPYQTLINLYLTDCAAKKRQLQMNWSWNMTAAQIDMELQKGVDDFDAGRVFTADDVEAEMRKAYGVKA